MNTEQDKRRKKLHIHRMTAVICSGLLVFAGGIGFVDISARAADHEERKALRSTKKASEAEDTLLLSLLRVYVENEKKPEEKHDYQFQNYAEDENLRKFVIEISPELKGNIEEQQEGTSEALDYVNEREAVKARMQELEREIKETLKTVDGIWSVYVKDLQNKVSFSINNEEMYAASLIKLFVMEKSFADYDEIVADYDEIVADCNEIVTEYKINVANSEGTDGVDNEASDKENEAEKYIDTLLKAMIEVSDNESYNELVKLQNEKRSFAEGAEELNDYIEAHGYTDTGLYHSLHPASSAQEWISMEQNHTSVEDCGLLLERIYDGECVSEAASADMLELLLNQQVVQKIPAGLPEDESVVCANKTGETDTDHHDAAIVFGPQTDYVLCIMSSEWIDGQLTVETIQEISGIVYKGLEKTRLHEDSVWDNRSR